MLIPRAAALFSLSECLKGQLLCGRTLPHRATLCFSLPLVSVCLSVCVRRGSQPRGRIQLGPFFASVLDELRVDKVLLRLWEALGLYNTSQAVFRQNTLTQPPCYKILYFLWFVPRKTFKATKWSVAIYVSDLGSQIVMTGQEGKENASLVFGCIAYSSCSTIIRSEWPWDLL